VISDQTVVEGQRKGVNVEDYPKAVSIGQILKDLEFPADKQKINQHVQKSMGNKVKIDYYLTKPWDPPEEHLYPVLDDLLDDWWA